jgi:hypothetical protein
VNRLGELLTGRPRKYGSTTDFIEEAYRQIIPQPLHQKTLAAAEYLGPQADAVDAYDSFREAGRALERGDYLSAAGHETLGAFSSLGLSEISKPLRSLVTDPSLLAAKKAIFAGVAARIADSKKFARAQRLVKSGADARTIWRETGWFQGADRKWRFEIDDRQSRIMPHELREIGNSDHREWRGRVSDLLDHPELFKAYPELADIDLRLRYRRDPSETGSAYFTPSSESGQPAIGVEQFGPTYLPMDPDELKKVLLHELQHGTQWREGFAPGGNTNSGSAAMNYLLKHTLKLSNDAKVLERLIDGRAIAPYKIDEARRKLDSLTKEVRWNERKLIALGNLSDYEIYLRLAGEDEARKVAARRALTPTQRLARPPWLGDRYGYQMQLLLPPLPR